jgi:ferrochelatase
VSSSEGFDALLVLSFGGPEGEDDVIPFLRNVTRGRDVPEARLAAVAARYERFGGVSPINEANRALIAAIGQDLAAHGIALPTYWGNRNWHPFLTDTVQRMADDGVRRALVLVTSATGGYSSCRQYLDDIDAARAAVGTDAPELVKLRHFFDHPGYVDAHASGVRDALAALPDELREDARLVFTAHSIPLSMNEASGPGGGLYRAQQDETARLVEAAVRGRGEYDLVWQSRSGPPHVPWLEPDINSHLRSLAAAGSRAVVIAPTGFVSDHMEVVWDLDIEAAQTAADVGLTMTRAATAGTHPSFIAAIRDLVDERLSGTAPVQSTCGPGCCGGGRPR